jgi:hypothetical protein
MYTNLDSIWPDHFTMLDTEDFKKQQVQGILNCEAETMATGTVIMMLKSFGLVDTLGKSLVSSL